MPTRLKTHGFIFITILLLVTALGIGTVSATSSDTDNNNIPEIVEDPVFATGLVYQNQNYPLVSTGNLGSVSPSNAIIEFSLGTNGPWYHTISDITNNIIGKNAGDYVVYYRATITSNNVDSSSSIKSKTVTIAKAANPITLSAISASKNFSSSDPALQISISGIIYNDGLSILPDYEAKRTSGESVGKYTIQINKIASSGSNTVADNYVINLENGEFTILPLKITDVTAGSINPQIYTGSPIKPEVTVSSSKSLKKGEDYIFTYENNTNAGTATLIVTAKEGSDYTFDSIRIPFQIVKANQPKTTVQMDNYAVGTTPSVPNVQNAKESPVATYYYTTDSTSSGTQWDITNPPQLTIGTYYMYAHLASTDNYNESTTDKTLFKVLDNVSTLTITYTYVNGTIAAPTYKHTYEIGDTYSIKSPEITNYMPSSTYISGTMGLQDVQTNAIYTYYNPTLDNPTYGQSGSGSKGGATIINTTSTTPKIYDGLYSGKNTYEFNYDGDIVVIRVVVPDGSDTTKNVKWWENTDSKPSGCWYRFEVSAPGYDVGKTGEIFFQIPVSVISSHKINGDGCYDVSLYQNGVILPTYFDSKDVNHVFYHSTITGDGIFDIVFAANTTHNAVSLTDDTTNSTTQASSPAPILGLIIGLSVAGFISRLRR